MIEDLSSHSSAVYVYKTVPHQACSKVTLGWWLCLYNVAQGTLRIEEAKYNKCKNAAHGNHEWLLPFLYDNRGLSLRDDLSEDMKHALREAEESKKRDSAFCYQDQHFLSQAVFGLRTSGQKGCIMGLRNICLLQANTK